MSRGAGWSNAKEILSKCKGGLWSRSRTKRAGLTDSWFASIACSKRGANNACVSREDRIRAGSRLTSRGREEEYTYFKR